jgi:hypothetical protein
MYGQNNGPKLALCHVYAYYGLKADKWQDFRKADSSKNGSFYGTKLITRDFKAFAYLEN